MQYTIIKLSKCETTSKMQVKSKLVGKLNKFRENCIKFEFYIMSISGVFGRLAYAELFACQDLTAQIKWPAGLDYCTSELSFVALFTARHGNVDGLFNDTWSLLPTNGSKSGSMVGKGFFIEELVIKVPLRLLDDGSDHITIAALADAFS